MPSDKKKRNRTLFLWGTVDNEQVEYSLQNSVLSGKKIKAVAAGDHKLLVLAEKKAYEYNPSVMDFTLLVCVYSSSSWRCLICVTCV